MKNPLTVRVQAAGQLSKDMLARAAGRVLGRSLLENPLLARRRWLKQFGWPGMAGIGLLVMCGAMYFSTLQPAEANLEEARRNAISLQEQVKLAANGLHQSQLTPAEQLAEFYRLFPDEKNLQPWLEKIFIVAQRSGIRLDQGEYKATRDSVGRLMRFQVTLPIRSEYPQIRRFLTGLRSEIPVIAVEHLEFERQRIGEPVVEAKIVLALYLVQQT